MHFVYAKSILSPDSMNVYRGCTHGCIYCDSRSTCYQMKHAFEDIEVKINAPQLLEDALRRKRSKCMIGTGAMCDPYMHCEEELKITRQCLEIIERYGFGAAIQTKSDRILRDLPLLQRINSKAKCVVQMTLTTYDEELCAILEPDVCTTRSRFETLLRMKEAGIHTVVWLSPVLPFLTDNEENIRGVLQYCIDAGVTGVICFGMGTTIRDGDREYFFAALDRHFPGLKERYIRRYGNAYECTSDRNAQLMEMFHQVCETHGIMHSNEEIFRWMHIFPERTEGQQLSFLEGL